MSKCRLPKVCSFRGVIDQRLEGFFQSEDYLDGRFIPEALVERVIKFIKYAETQLSLVSNESETLQEAKALLKEICDE